MALVEDFCIVLTTECALFKFQDKINWGAPEVERNEGGHVLLAAHVNQDLSEDFITIDSTPYQTKIEYDVNNDVDGHYLFELLRFPIFDINTNYVKEVKDVNNIITTYANLVYYPNLTKFFKAIEDTMGHFPDDVDGATYWEEITSFNVESVRKNDKITVYRYDAIFTCRSRKCVKSFLLDLGCGCDDIKKQLAYYKRKSMLDGAGSLANDERYAEAETNIRLLENMCPKC